MLSASSPPDTIISVAMITGANPAGAYCCSDRPRKPIQRLLLCCRPTFRLLSVIVIKSLLFFLIGLKHYSFVVFTIYFTNAFVNYFFIQIFISAFSHPHFLIPIFSSTFSHPHFLIPIFISTFHIHIFDPDYPSQYSVIILQTSSLSI